MLDLAEYPKYLRILIEKTYLGNTDIWIVYQIEILTGETSGHIH